MLNRSHVRDGKPYAPKSIEEFEILPEASTACQMLKAAGFLLIVVTNQPDVGNGFVAREVVEAMNQKLLRDLPLDDLEVCYASQQDGSPRRKPQPGMLLDAAAKWNIALDQSFLIGDRWSDAEAGKAAGCTTVHIERGYFNDKPCHAHQTVETLHEAVDWILQQTG